MLSHAVPAPAQAPIYISGRVISKATGQAVPGATVSLFTAGQTDPAAITEALVNGAFVLEVPQSGAYQLVTTARNRYFAAARSLQVPAGGLSSLVIACDSLTLCDHCRPFIRLALTTKDQAPAASVPTDVRVQLSAGSLGPLRFVDRQPRLRRGAAFVRIPPYVLKQLLAGHQTLAQVDSVDISVRHGADGYGAVHLIGWPEAPVPVSLRPGFTLSGTVDDRGQPAPGAVVIVTPPAEWAGLVPLRRFTVEPNGAFTVPDLAPGEYQILVRMRHGRRFRQPVLVSSSQAGLVFSPVRG